jgi:hypothetical protein
MYNKDRELLQEQYQKILEGQFGTGGQAVTKAELVNIIKDAEAQHKGTNFFSVTQVTKETTNKADSPSFTLPGLKSGKTYFAKVTRVNIQVGYDYASSVNKQREREGKEGDFVSKPSPYTPMPDSNVLVTKGDQIYARYRPIQTSATVKPVYVKAKNETPSSAQDFEIVSKQDVEKFKGASVKAGQYQGLDVGVEVRTISLDSVVSANIAGKSYTVSDLDPLRKAIFDVVNGPAPAALPAP